VDAMSYGNKTDVFDSWTGESLDLSLQPQITALILFSSLVMSKKRGWLVMC